MKYAGGFESYRALLEDARAYDDVIVMMMGEADGERIRAQMAKARSA